MPLDPQIQALLDKAAAAPQIQTLSVADARKQFESRIAAMPEPAAVAAVGERNIAGPGGNLTLRIYTPPGQGPFPLMVFFHGSGFVVCSLDTHDGMARNLCAGAGCVVVSVDYRLAPEHKFPAAPDDCLAATRWVAAHAAELGARADRVMVSGDSAGANLAAVTALRIRDEGGPPLVGQMLLYPVTDHYTAGMASYIENAEGYGLGRDAMKWFWDHYLAKPEDSGNPCASPLRARDLSRLPPAFVLTAEYDPLRDEGELYGKRLQIAGVPAVVTRCDGVNHGFLFWVGMVDRSTGAMKQACDWARRAFR